VRVFLIFAFLQKYNYIGATTMLMPVRCYTCNRVLGHMWKEYKLQRDAGQDAAEIFDFLGIPPKSYCCKRMLISHIETIDTVLGIIPGE